MLEHVTEGGLTLRDRIDWVRTRGGVDVFVRLVLAGYPPEDANSLTDRTLPESREEGTRVRRFAGTAGGTR